MHMMITNYQKPDLDYKSAANEHPSNILPYIRGFIDQVADMAVEMERLSRLNSTRVLDIVLAQFMARAMMRLSAHELKI